MSTPFPARIIVAAASCAVPLLLGAAAAVAADPATRPAIGPTAVATYFVAPGGDDGWSGALPEPNAGRTDGPFATPGRARDAVRDRRRAGGGTPPGPAVVEVRGGTYFLPEPLAFTPGDSGSADAPIAYVARAGEKPTLSGGRRVAGWAASTVNGKEVWSAPLPPGVRLDVRSLWVNGQRRTRARHPNKGYLRVAGVPGKRPGAPWQEPATALAYHPGEFQDWPGVADAELLVFSRWIESRVPVARVDEAARTVHFGKKTVFELQPDDLFHAEGAAAFLDAPGEWFVDRRTATIRYVPVPGETPATVEAIVSALQQVVRIAGDPAAGRYVEHLTFRGLAFAHAEFDLYGRDGRGPSGFAQAASGVSAAVSARGARHCAFDRCAVAHIGGYGIELGGACQGNTVAGCTLSDLGAGGVRIGEVHIRDDPREQSFGNTVADCRITDGGRLFHSGIGVWVGQSYDNVIARCEIADFYYTGVSIGWTWGYGRSLARGNVLERCHVHHIGRRSDGDGPVLSDMACAYTLGVQPGTVVRDNRFHDAAGLKYGGWGIYFDEGSSGIVAERNLVYRTTHGGFHQHYGRDNVVRNNIFAFGRDAQIHRSRAEPHQSFAFERNVVYWDRGEAVTGGWEPLNARFDHNVYGAVGGAVPRFGSLPWEAWRANGMDAHSALADPLFVDAAGGDYRLRDGSPAVRAGFVPFDPSAAGPRP